MHLAAYMRQRNKSHTQERVVEKHVDKIVEVKMKQPRKAKVSKDWSAEINEVSV